MTESASAVSQIAEEEHKGGKQLKGEEQKKKERENLRDKTEGGKRAVQVNASRC